MSVLTNANLTVALDTGRIVRTDSGQTIWMRTDYTEPQHLPDVPDEPYIGLEAHMDVDCREQRGRLLRIIVLGPARDSIADHTYDMPWQDFDAEPFAPSVMEPLCRAVRTRTPARGAA